MALCTTAAALAAPPAASAPTQSTGVTADTLPAMADALRARMTFPMAWNGEVSDLARWRQAGIAKVWELSLQAPDTTPFDLQVLDEVDRGSYWARKIAFSLTADSRVKALLLVPKGAGPFPGAVLYHDHGARFDIGKEKLIQPWGDDARLASATQWATKYFSGRFPGDALAQRGYVVLATDALGWGDRGPLAYEQQQALAANLANLGSSWAGLMALEDVRAAELLASLPQVRPGQVAAVGFSMGAFRAWQAAALSDIITATVAAHWMASAPSLMVPGNNQLRGASAWAMLHPGLLRLLDYPDVAALAAPKPLLLYSGAQDPLLPQAAVQPAFAKLRRVWAAWQADKNLETRVWPNGHVFGQDQQEAAFEWLDRQWSVSR